MYSVIARIFLVLVFTILPFSFELVWRSWSAKRMWTETFVMIFLHRCWRSLCILANLKGNAPENRLVQNKQEPWPGRSIDTLMRYYIVFGCGDLQAQAMRKHLSALLGLVLTNLQGRVEHQLYSIDPCPPMIFEPYRLPPYILKILIGI